MYLVPLRSVCIIQLTSLKKLQVLAIGYITDKDTAVQGLFGNPVAATERRRHVSRVHSIFQVQVTTFTCVKVQ